MFWPWRKKAIPEEDLKCFLARQSVGATLPAPAKLMPCFDTCGYRQTMRALRHIVLMPAGTTLEFLKIRMKGTRAWYKVRAHCPASDGRRLKVGGWINSIILEGV